MAEKDKKMLFVVEESAETYYHDADSVLNDCGSEVKNVEVYKFVGYATIKRNPPSIKINKK